MRRFRRFLPEPRHARLPSAPGPGPGPVRAATLFATGQQPSVACPSGDTDLEGSGCYATNVIVWLGLSRRALQGPSEVPTNWPRRYDAQVGKDGLQKDHPRIIRFSRASKGNQATGAGCLTFKNAQSKGGSSAAQNPPPALQSGRLQLAASLSRTLRSTCPQTSPRTPQVHRTRMQCRTNKA